jgi:hypothetical protein
MVEGQLGGILDRHDALVPGYQAGEHVQQRRLAGPSAARDEQVAAVDHAQAQELEHPPVQRAARKQVVGAEPPPAEAPDGHRRAAQRDRRDDHVDARPIGEARIHHR